MAATEADVHENPKNHENERLFNKHKRMISNTMSTMTDRLNAKNMLMMEKLDEMLKIMARGSAGKNRRHGQTKCLPKSHICRGIPDPNSISEPEKRGQSSAASPKSICRIKRGLQWGLPLGCKMTMHAPKKIKNRYTFEDT